MVRTALEGMTGFRVAAVNVHGGRHQLQTEPNELREKRYTFMTRNTAREIATHLAYELSFNDLPVEEFLDLQLSGESFAALAPEHPSMRSAPTPSRRSISAVSSPAWRSTRRSWTRTSKICQGLAVRANLPGGLRIMRVAMFEILYMPDIPHGVAISEAVNIAKDYESPEVVKFINGILGSFLRAEVKE